MAKDRVEAVDRALTLLEAFHEPGEQLTLAQLSERTGLYKSTILRLAGSLQHFGYLSRDPAGIFRLGASLWRLGSLYRRDFLPAELVRPVLQKLADEAGETASFYVREGDERVCLYRENSRQALRHHLDEGARLPLDRGAAGRMLIAHGDDPDGVFRKVKEAGFTVSLGERDPEVGAIAVPIIDRLGVCVGVLALSGPLGRFTPQKIAQTRSLLVDAASILGDPS